MIQDIRLHGSIAARYEYYTTIIGPGIDLRFFYEQGEDRLGWRDRFFFGGNEVALYSDQIYHRGNGGTFCDYMLGIAQPVKDLLKPEVRNRLVMYGARYDEEGEHIIFTNETAGRESYQKIFSEAHAFANYSFFIAGDIQGDLKTVQESVLRLTGKFLKRSDLSDDSDGHRLAQRLYREIDISRWTLFLLKLIDLYAFDYYRAFTTFYSEDRSIDIEQRSELLSLASKYRLSQSECDRLELDAVYKHPENRKLIDDYKEVLISRYHGKQNNQIVELKRNRLRTMGAQRHLPSHLFDKLDKALRPRQTDYETPICLIEAKKCLQEIAERSLATGISSSALTEDQFTRFLCARLEALESHYSSFDDIVTELKHEYEVRTHQSVEIFDAVIAHSERFENAYGIVKSVALIDDYDLTEEKLFQIAITKDIVDCVRSSMFDELIFNTIEHNSYLNIHGRERLKKLKEGINLLLAGEVYPEEIVESIRNINKELRLRNQIEKRLRERIRDFGRQSINKQEYDLLRADLGRRLIQEGVAAEEIPPDLFSSVLVTIREERLYIEELLPQIILNRDLRLREDFLENTSLDRFRTEELEQQYLYENGFGSEVLDWLNSRN
ncbi:MAG: TIGR04442 family protein [Blastocatellia bacterium]|nr:TIGR04442 family protein [Blastocatellia bacterium]